MRIVQIIDSLEVGGAERMAVNYANALSKEISFSGLVVTRKEGRLNNEIDANVSYLYLNKRYALDLGAIFRLKIYCKRYRVEYVHAHGTSYFSALLLKIFLINIKIIWHEHYGARGEEKRIQNKILFIASKFFSGIIVVNQALEKWSISVLKFKKVIYLPNFILANKSENDVTILKGKEDQRILCLANLKNPKNHNLLIRVAKLIKKTHPDCTFHLVGKDFDDAYSRKIKKDIKSNHLQETVFIYGVKEDTNHIIKQATIAVLTSESEGLPVALLEYGFQKKPIVVTNVGEIPFIIEDEVNGLMVESDNDELFYKAIISLLENLELRNKLGEQLYETVVKNNSEQEVIKEYLNWIKKI
jgi:glycosyltransferase involved in cell wall biosynthesis